MEQIDNLSDDARPNLPDDLPSPEQQLSDLAAQIIANIKKQAVLDKEMIGKISESESAIYADYSERHFTPLRIARGRMLLEAQKLVPKGQWQKWCAEQFPSGKSWVSAHEATREGNRPLRWVTMTSQRDLRACMELARAADPIAAHEAEKANTRERVAKHRQAKKSGVTRADVTPVAVPDKIAKTAQSSAPDARIEAPEMPEPEPISPEDQAQITTLTAEIIEYDAKATECLKDQIREWWEEHTDSARRAFGEWFDELRARSEPAAAEPQQSPAQDLDLAAE